LASKAMGGGGPLMGFGSHHVDLMQWLAGPIQDIDCYQNNRVWPDIEVEDTAVVILRFLNKAIGCALYTWGARIEGQSENFSVYGTGGSLVLQNEELYHISEKTYQDRQPRRLDTTRSDQQDIEAFGKEIAISSLEPFVRQLQEFIHCVQTHQPPPVDGAAATATVEKILQAYHMASVK